jgi:putative ABC transport system permease protein
MRTYLQTLTSIHLYSDVIGEIEPNSSITTLYIFASVGFVVLLLACVNFVNITTARSANRAKEVGVRKVVGAASIQLMRQFILEAVLMVLAAAILAVLIVSVAQYPFNVITGKAISAATLVEPVNLLILVAFIVSLGIVAGSYPAFVLTAFNATRVLRGSIRMGFRSRRLRSVLVVIQFAVAIILITATLVVDEQLRYMRSRKLGFDQENVIVIENGDKITGAAAFQKMLRAMPLVRDVGTGATKPIGGYDGLPLAAENLENVLLVNYSTVDAAYLKALQYQFVEGRNFTSAITDTSAIILNRSAATALLGDKPLGRKVAYPGRRQLYTVIGVVEDFNYQSLRNAVTPVVFFYKPDQRYICVRFKPGDPAQGVAVIEALWKKQYPDIPFVFTYLDETYASLYKGEVQLGITFGIFTVLALLIACLGLVGLSVYISQQRSKEISVRKVFGASIMQITLLLSREFIRLILVACLLAVPAAYYIMALWLNDFAYHISIGPWVLAQGCLIVLLAGVGAVAYQSVRASILNPAQSLKEE